MSAAPVLFNWDGEAMVPLRPQHADRVFVVGERYPLVVHEDRSAVSHRHFFACVREAFTNLSDGIATEFATPDHLRKRALVETGHYTERRLVASSPAEARKVAAFIRAGDDYAVVSVAGSIVVERKAKSQSHQAMPKGEFQKSKTDVLDYLSSLIGVTPETLNANAERAA